LSTAGKPPPNVFERRAPSASATILAVTPRTLLSGDITAAGRRRRGIFLHEDFADIAPRNPTSAADVMTRAARSSFTAFPRAVGLRTDGTVQWGTVGRGVKIVKNVWKNGRQGRVVQNWMVGLKK
jgi:hypothetical protein